MPRLIPEAPSFAAASEQDVWEILRDQLGPDDVLMTNVRLTTSDRDHEADLVVLMPDYGVLVLEIKGGSVWHDDGWWQSDASQRRRIDPVQQALDSKYALRSFVEHRAGWGSRGRIAWSHGVVVPYSSFPADDALPELPRFALHDRDDLAHLATRVRQNAHGLDQQHRVPTLDDIEAVVHCLAGRSVRGYRDPNAESAERAAEADRLTEQQSLILQVTRLLRRVEVRGGAGSGKTVLALQKAKELQRGRGDTPPQRVALLCYSLGLAEHFKREVAGWKRRERPSFVGTWEELGRSWGAPEGTREDSAFWEERLPAIMTELAGELPDGKRFDAIVIDEAQDFADSWWRPLLRSLRSEERGGIYVFADENQRVFSRFGRPPVELVPLVLDHCLRNTKQVFEAFGPMTPSRMYARGGEGPEVRFVPATADQALAKADDEVDRLLDEGWDPGRVALITTGHRHPVQVEVTERHGQEAYWQRYFDDEDVFYGHVLGCKGLERAAVVLCLNEDGSRDRARERLYVGMSRATDQLVVVGDPEFVVRAGGPEVAKRLGIAAT
ncbi:nuclease-related domain-containing DEAD/DEAH box helicase [Nocardioides sambongensis]|uniref:nuclease-related domain-containing DEAD/DEAH box helicase n=1 Tax=Nocardioides sambongensis TaxID=2589074 RepID=UPI00112626E4|nr:NERD domain-containing protein [Nocardioides sambongensis]